MRLIEPARVSLAATALRVKLLSHSETGSFPSEDFRAASLVFGGWIFFDSFCSLLFLELIFALLDFTPEHDPLTLNSLLEACYVDIVGVLHTLFTELLDHLVIVPHVDEVLSRLYLILKYFLELLKA